MIFYLALLFTVVARSDATSCECNKINSWEELRSLILVHNKIESSVQQKILLCPFSIKKTITKETNHWDEFIPINAPMHLSCHKESASDACSIVIEGEKCEFEENCGRQMIKIKSSEFYTLSKLRLISSYERLANLTLSHNDVIGDVTIEGLKITKAKDNIISTEKNLQNINLIDLAFYQNSVPGSLGYSNALISVGGGTSLQILYSEFGWVSRNESIAFAFHFKNMILILDCILL